MRFIYVGFFVYMKRSSADVRTAELKHVISVSNRGPCTPRAPGFRCVFIQKVHVKDPYLLIPPTIRLARSFCPVCVCQLSKNKLDFCPLRFCLVRGYRWSFRSIEFLSTYKIWDTMVNTHEPKAFRDLFLFVSIWSRNSCLINNEEVKRFLCFFCFSLYN